MTIRILLVAYFFPPSASTGAERPLCFARYLPESGVEVEVLTVVERLADQPDPLSLNRLPEGLRVHRAGAVDLESLAVRCRSSLPTLSGLIRRLSFPDTHAGWIPGAILAGRRALSERPFDAVLSTCAPMSAHLVGLALSRSFGIPFVADFRDPWTDPIRPPGTGLRYKADLALERAISRAADLVVTTCAACAASVVTRFGVAAPRSIAIPNGYDEDMFTGPHPAFSGPPPLADGRCNFLHVGYPYGGEATLLDGMRRFLTARPDAASHAHLTLLGGGIPAELLSRFAVADAVTLLPRVGMAESLHWMNRATALLAVLPDDPRWDVRIVSRLWNSLRTKRPLVAVMRESEAAAIARRVGVASIVHPADPAGLAKAFEVLYERWKSGELEVPDAGPGEAPEELKRFERRRSVARLALALRSLVAERT